MNKEILASSLCAGAIAFASFHPASIHTAQGQEAYDELVVTATRTPVSLSDSLSSVTVISQEDLQALQPADLVDVFHQVPGIDISRSGGPGSNASLFTRGTASDHTLILVDGQRINSATAGGTAFQFLDPAQIERIEVVRGASSSLYGSDAIGGVVQIFTRDGADESGHYLSTGGGSYGRWQAGAGTNGREGNWRYGANISHLETDGIDHHVDESGFNGERDSYRNTSVNASLGYAFDGGADLSLRMLRNDSRNEYDDIFNAERKPYAENRIRNFTAKLELPVTERWSSRLSLGRSTDGSEHFDALTGAFDSHFRTDRDQALWQNDFRVAEDHTLTLGAEYYEDRVDSSSAFEDAEGNAVDTRWNRALFAQHQARLAPFTLVLGLRNDDNEAFGGHTTGNASLGYSLDERHQLTLSWSEGFKAPTFNDLYWPAGTFDAGNPDLVPESSENYEAGFRGNYQTWYWSASYYENDIHNLINWAPGDDGIWRPTNIDDAEIRGGELIAGAFVDGWRLEGSLNHSDPRDAEQDTVLPNRARNTAQLTVDRELERWSLGLSLKAQSRRYVDSSNEETLSGYGTVGARIAYRHNEQLSARLKLDNLLDRDYQLNEGFNQMGANWRLNLTWSL